MRYGRHMVTAGVHYGGEEISRETCLPLIAAPPLLFFLQKPSLEDSEQCAVILNETASFQFQNDISDLVLGCFYNFVIKPPPPGKVVIGSFDFSAFSSLVLGFGLFQLSP
jgi:hypothetical protein